MCGIVGYIGEENAFPILLKSLKNLEYRGYDSAGFATLNSRIVSEKDIGKIEPNKPVYVSFGNPIPVGGKSQNVQQDVINFIVEKLDLWGVNIKKYS